MEELKILLQKILNKDLQQIIFIIIPLKDHIVESGTDNGKNDPIQCKIHIQIRVLSPPFCIRKSHRHTG